MVPDDDAGCLCLGLSHTLDETSRGCVDLKVSNLSSANKIEYAHTADHWIINIFQPLVIRQQLHQFAS